MQDTKTHNVGLSADSLIFGWYHLEPTNQDTAIVERKTSVDRQVVLSRASAAQTIAKLREYVEPNRRDRMLSYSVATTILATLSAAVFFASGILVLLSWLSNDPLPTSTASTVCVISLVGALALGALTFVFDRASQPGKSRMTTVQTIFSKELVSTGMHLPPAKDFNEQSFYDSITPEVRDRLVSLVDAGEEDVVTATLWHLVDDARATLAAETEARKTAVALRVEEVLSSVR